MKKILRSLPLLLVCITNVLFSHQPSPILMDLGFTWQDKLYHVGAFIVLGISAMYALSSWKMPTMYRILSILFFGAFWGMMDEIHQSFIPNRTAAVDDWIADLIGISISLLFIRYFYPKENNNELSAS